MACRFRPVGLLGRDEVGSQCFRELPWCNLIVFTGSRMAGGGRSMEQCSRRWRQGCSSKRIRRSSGSAAPEGRVEVCEHGSAFGVGHGELRVGVRRAGGGGDIGRSQACGSGGEHVRGPVVARVRGRVATLRRATSAREREERCWAKPCPRDKGAQGRGAKPVRAGKKRKQINKNQNHCHIILKLPKSVLG